MIPSTPWKRREATNIAESGLLNLPIELSLEIVSYLCGPDLVVLGQTCSRLRAFVSTQPALIEHWRVHRNLQVHHTHYIRMYACVLCLTLEFGGSFEQFPAARKWGRKEKGPRKQSAICINCRDFHTLVVQRPELGIQYDDWIALKHTRPRNPDYIQAQYQERRPYDYNKESRPPSIPKACPACLRWRHKDHFRGKEVLQEWRSLKGPHVVEMPIIPKSGLHLVCTECRVDSGELFPVNPNHEPAGAEGCSKCAICQAWSRANGGRLIDTLAPPDQNSDPHQVALDFCTQRWLAFCPGRILEDVKGKKPREVVHQLKNVLSDKPTSGCPHDLCTRGFHSEKAIAGRSRFLYYHPALELP
jgi:hypothetical protein